jgi:CRISPR-associated protein Csb2
MPIKRGSTTLVFDAFVVLNRDAEVIFTWPDVTLSDEEASVLENVLSQMSYFGRRESWCTARIVPSPAENEVNCRPLETGDGPLPNGWEIERVLCADPDTALQNEHTPKKIIKSGKGKSARTAEYPIYDPDWHLCLETLELHDKRWSDPPGSRWIDYVRRSDCLAGDPSARTYRPRQGAGPDYVAARFVIDGSVLPLVTETVYVAEIARQVLQGIYGKLFYGESSPVFSGKAENGRRLEGHRHAFFLPTDEDGDGRIDHITITTSTPFTAKEIAALDRLRRMRKPGGGDELNMMLVGLPNREYLMETGSIPILSCATVWRSVTPFIPIRHYKKRGRKRDTCPPEDFPETVLREEAARRGLPDPLRVEALPECSMWDHGNRREVLSSRRLRWIQFRRQRVLGNGKKGSHSGCGFIVTFPESITGPLALGYGCHFGLGLFAPIQ